MNRLIELGYADEAGIVASVDYTVSDGRTGKGFLCVNGEVVTLAAGDEWEKVFKDSIDRLDGMTVKSGLFKKRILFTYNGLDYTFTVKNGKNLIDYFKLLAADKEN
ncbi:MAG: hypothetical protein J1G01_00075 [Clostridiales bacterium]|nr:hypothetical protein [Clostridiales bacterium]